MIQFEVVGDPVAQGRPRFTTAGGYARAYDPAKSRDYKDYVRLAAAQAMKGQAPLEGALALSICVYRPIPKSFGVRKSILAEAGGIRPTSKPDIANYVKGIEDALNGICWKDDSQIVEYIQPFGKFYSDRPRVVIKIEQVN